jgi:hypothetical protein
MVEGGCLCGEIRYRVDNAITDVSHCHCGMCRKHHGAAFATFGEAAREHFHWLHGEDKINVYCSSAQLERWFCNACGSSLLCRTDEEPDIMYLALGTLDDDPGSLPAYHIWVGSKAPWYEITDDLPRFEEEDG